MTQRRHALTPEALEMMDTIARTGSFAAAARELGKVPSALTYNVRQLEEALDALLFDRSSRQAQLTAAGQELLSEGRRLLQQMDAVANRVQRVATGWETSLAIAVDTIIAPSALYDLIEAFYGLETATGGPPPTRLRVQHEVLTGTWEALLTGQVDLAIGVIPTSAAQQEVRCEPLGVLDMVMAVAPHHPLAHEPEPVPASVVARHRIAAIADTAQRMERRTFGVQPGQDVLTLPSLVAKLEAQIRGLACGRLPETLVRRHVEAGRLVLRQLEEPVPPIDLHYAWRRSAAPPGSALAWWLQQLASPTTRRALLEQHTGLMF
ncbi:DNA-binding transcriptional LysR family regulator [Sphaerotilus hippei]|uniref:DNA-binding transcriptional LysR family regulator n=1 Tax=Sphaerotilus hippei TaxID=744406 RepID=A0A318GXL2_9BURK|nr:LysR family transcriptional regulator [Sphaerotilus hippei]PXW92883.1 DNA-binding transcriptional LysR family regulator [Sphaerotilus hippei]